MARGVAIDLLQMAKRVGPQYKVTEYEDLSGEENLTLDRIVADDRRSHLLGIIAEIKIFYASPRTIYGVF